MGLGLLVGAAIVGTVVGSNVSKSKLISDNSQSYKVSFYDEYRNLDNYLGRLVGQGSGGVGLLILTYKYTDFYLPVLGSWMSVLKEVRDYRNNLSHNKNRWAEISDPETYYFDCMCEIRREIESYETYVSRSMYKELFELNRRR